jgi:hypothetical protein
VGSALAAGISPLMGIRGLLLDALESVRMVTADGKLVTASRTQNSGLFWALRGAGNNFGVVTSATFKVYDATNDAQAMVATMIFPAVANKSFWEVLQSFDENLPPGLAITALGFYYRQFNMVRIQSYYFLMFSTLIVNPAHNRVQCDLLWPTGRRRSVPGAVRETGFHQHHDPDDASKGPLSSGHGLLRYWTTYQRVQFGSNANRSRSLGGCICRHVQYVAKT